MVRVRDLDASLDFYCGKLGMREVRRIENDKGRFTLVFLAAPADNTYIAPARKFWSNPNLKNVEFSIEKARKVLADAGYTWDGDGKLRYPKA